MDLKEAVTVCCEPAGSAIGVELLPTRTRVSAATATGSARELEDAAVVVKLVKIVAASNDAYDRAIGVELLPTRTRVSAATAAGSASELEDAALVVKLIKIVGADSIAHGRGIGGE